MPPSGSDYTQRFKRLIEVSRDLNTAQDIKELLQAVVMAACELTDSQFSSILLYEAETDLLKFVACLPAYKEALKHIRVPVERSTAGWVYANGKPLVIPKAEGNPMVFREVERALGVAMQSIAAVPLVFKGETIGVLEASNKHDGANYTEDDIIILESLASQAAFATLSTLLLEEAQHAYDELKELERMKSDFIAVASHELRTPLGLILGHATFLSETVQDQEARHQIEVIVRSAERLKKIIEDLSNVNNFQMGTARLKRQFVPLGQLIVKLVDAAQEAARRKKISLTTRLPPKAELVVEGDEDKIAIALNNLLNNAITFTDENGHVLVSAEMLPGYVKVSVIDDGIGIPAKDLPRVFDRFFQVQSHLTRKHGGMGLGLSVAKAMVEMHGGQIWAESVEGKGSQFSILLPLKPLRAKAPSVFET